MLKALLLNGDSIVKLLKALIAAVQDKIKVLQQMVELVQQVIDLLKALSASGLHVLSVATNEGVEGLVEAFTSAKDRPGTDPETGELTGTNAIIGACVLAGGSEIDPVAALTVWALMGQSGSMDQAFAGLHADIGALEAESKAAVADAEAALSTAWKGTESGSGTPQDLGIQGLLQGAEPLLQQNKKDLLAALGIGEEEADEAARSDRVGLARSVDSARGAGSRSTRCCWRTSRRPAVHSAAAHGRSRCRWAPSRRRGGGQEGGQEGGRRMKFARRLRQEVDLWGVVWQQVETFVDRISGAADQDASPRQKVEALLAVASVVERARRPMETRALGAPVLDGLPTTRADESGDSEPISDPWSPEDRTARLPGLDDLEPRPVR